MAKLAASLLFTAVNKDSKQDKHLITIYFENAVRKFRVIAFPIIIFKVNDYNYQLFKTILEYLENKQTKRQKDGHHIILI